MARAGLPQGWSERFKSGLVGIVLPDGAEFYVTPGHGFLRVDTRRHKATVTDYDYSDGPHHVLLEEDCSMTLWLADNGLVPMEPYMEKMRQAVHG